MRKFLLLGLLLPLHLGAQLVSVKNSGGYQFKTIKNLETTEVQNQGSTGTCWSFSSLSFFETEMIRMGKGKLNLAEMFVARNIYLEKAEKYVRMHGTFNFGPGGAFHDVLITLEKYGMLPEEVYSGNNYGEKKHNHSEMDAMLKAMMEALVKNPNGRLTSVWKEAMAGVLDAYLGKVPQNFTHAGKNYTPRTYADATGLKASDYVEITSFTHQPFYKPFILEVPDNWAMLPVYNVPLDEMTEVMNYALDKGFSIAWASDVSEKGFSWKNGVAIVPEKEWSDITKADMDTLFKSPIKQRVITQEARQKGFDNYETQDDHGMHITGLIEDQNKTKYYIVKNSWGKDSNECDGYIYASESFVRLKTTCIMLHKDAIPSHIAQKLGIKK